MKDSKPAETTAKITRTTVDGTEQDTAVTALLDGKEVSMVLRENIGGNSESRSARVLIGDAPTGNQHDSHPAEYTVFAEPKYNTVHTSHTHVVTANTYPEKIADVVVNVFDSQSERDKANQAPGLISMVEAAMLKKDIVTSDELRMIRDAFQQIETPPEHATNAGLPQPQRGKSPSMK